jgi:plastocyanin
MAAMSRRFAGILLLLPGLWIAPATPAASLSGEVEVWEPVSGQPVKLEDRSNAVIFVAGFVEPPAKGAEPKLAQHNKSFSERVLAITVGNKVEFPNEDPIHHNVWSRSPARPFDLGLYKAPETHELDFPAPGIVTVFCNIHPQMIATILVLPNNRYFVTGPDGRYRIEGIPPGDWPVYAWVEGAQPIKQVVRFAGNGAVTLGFRLLLQRIPLRHLNKEGKPYKSYSGD